MAVRRSEAAKAPHAAPGACMPDNQMIDQADAPKCGRASELGCKCAIGVTRHGIARRVVMGKKGKAGA